MVCHSVSFIPSKKYSAFGINSPKLPKLHNRGAIDSRTFLSEFSSFRTSCGSRLPFLPVPFLLFWSKEPQAASSYEAIFHTGCIPSNFGNAGEDPGGNCGAEGPLAMASQLKSDTETPGFFTCMGDASSFGAFVNLSSRNISLNVSQQKLSFLCLPSRRYHFISLSSLSLDIYLISDVVWCQWCGAKWLLCGVWCDVCECVCVCMCCRFLRNSNSFE